MPDHANSWSSRAAGDDGMARTAGRLSALEPPAGRARRTLQEEGFDRLAERFLVRFRGSRARNFHALWVALDRARQDVAGDGTLGVAASRRLYECACRDLTQMASLVVRGPRGEGHRLRETTRDHGAVHALFKALQLSGDAIYRVAGEAGRSETRRAGDITCAGGLSCVDCGATRHSRYTTTVGTCRHCMGKVFVKNL